MATIRTKCRCFVRLQTQLYEYNYYDTRTRSSTAACNRTSHPCTPCLYEQYGSNHHQHDHPANDAV
eukprot:scaffold195180_cov18-Prasinocladus_malaysianus.AAC.1